MTDDAHVEIETPDVSPAVPPRRSLRARYIVAALVCFLVVGGLLWFGLNRNIVYFRTATEAVETRSRTGADRFRLAGAVVPGSVQETPEGVTFEVTDGTSTVRVVHRGDPPELFAEGAPVVCEGNWGRDVAFRSDRILIKHGNEYAPPQVDVPTEATTPSPGLGS